MKKSVFALLCFLFLAQLCTAQKKELGYEQIFGNTPAGISKPLPNIIRWLDDDHYLERREEVFVSVEAGTGQATPYRSPATETGSGEDTPVNADTREDIPADAVDAALSPDGKWVAYTRANNLFAKELASGKEVQFTHDGSDNIYNGHAALVYYEEMFGRSYRAFWWSPDSRHIAFIHFDETQVPVFPIFHSEGQHGSLEKRHYPQAGDKNPAVRIGIVSIDEPKTVWADFNEKDDQYFGPPFWTPDGSSLWVQWISRDQHDLKIFSVDIVTGSKKRVYEEHQNTWVNAKYGIGFLQNTRQFIINSDKSGWNHLYLYNMDGTLANQMTKGEFAIDVVQTDETNKVIYFLSRKENPGRVDFYRIGFDGKGLTRLSFGDYTQERVLLSPNAKYFISTYSNAFTPAKMALLDTRGKWIRALGDSKGADFDRYDLARREVRRVKTRDSLYDLPVEIIYPLHFDPNKKYPVLVEVYGGPDLGTFNDRWSTDLREQWWAREGLIQMTMDYRSSGHFGKAGMNYIYGNAGKYEIEDFMDCARWLRGQPFADTTKVCILGFSYGGFITCMALTYGADVFTHGIAYYPVTDWNLYDTYYGERFMGTPQDNPEGYRTASPMHFAKNYKGLLRIIQGDIDDNVHMQNTMQFIDTLEKLDKHFELMIYPGERHGRGHWSGQRKIHSYNEEYLFLYDHLLNKPMPDVFWKR